MNTREQIQLIIGRRCEEYITAMFDIAKENYLNGISQRAINEYSSILIDKSLNLQLRVAFLHPSEQEEMYDAYLRGGVEL